MSWFDVKLKDICSLVTSGGTPLRSVSEYYEGGTIPWMKTGEVKRGLVFETEEHITERALKESSAKLIPINSLIVAMYGDGVTAGNVAINKIPLATNQACCNFVVDPKKAFYKFIYYYLKASYSNLVGLKLGGSQQNLNAKSLKEFPLRIPELAVQKKIASTLSAYDDLIENNRRRIELLEQMAEELYREWFVRFRFPGYQQAKFHKGLPAEWELKKLKDILELCYGKALKEEQRQPGVFPVYGSSGVVGYHNKALADGPGIIIGRKGNVGSIHWADTGFFPIDTAYFVKAKISLHYVFFMLGGLNFINNDSAVPGLNREQAYSNPVLLPPATLIEKFEEIVISYFAEKQRLLKKNVVLSEMRDQLLTRLISGKLPVDQLDIQFPPSMREADKARQEVAHA